MRREESVASLVGALLDVDEEVREQAAWALGLIVQGGDDEDVESSTRAQRERSESRSESRGGGAPRH